MGALVLKMDNPRRSNPYRARLLGITYSFIIG